MNEYTPAQAAVVTDLPLSAVHKAIDRGVVAARSLRSGKTVQRLLTKDQLVFLQLEAEGVRLLPVATRKELRKLCVRPQRRNRSQWQMAKLSRFNAKGLATK